MSIEKQISKINKEIKEQAELIAVSKTRSIEDINEAYNQGQKKFGENRVQEIVDKFNKLPKDIEWHMIGHLQKHKVKYIKTNKQAGPELCQAQEKLGLARKSSIFLKG